MSNEIMTGTYQVMEQDQQFVFQPSQMTVMACENEGEKDGEGKKDCESTFDRLGDEEDTADNDLEEIGSKHMPLQGMMEPIAQFEASLIIFYTLDGKTSGVNTTECSTSIATMRSPSLASSVSPQSSNEKHRFHHICNQCHEPCRRMCNLRYATSSFCHHNFSK